MKIIKNVMKVVEKLYKWSEILWKTICNSVKIVEIVVKLNGIL